jgi:hypothetical protein
VPSVPESTPDVPAGEPVEVPEPVVTSLRVTLDRTWPDGAGAYVIEGLVGKIYIKPNYFSGPPPAELTLSGFNLIAQPAPVVKKVKVEVEVDPVKAEALRVKAARLLERAGALTPKVEEVPNAFAGLVDA